MTDSHRSIVTFAIIASLLVATAPPAMAASTTATTDGLVVDIAGGVK